MIKILLIIPCYNEESRLHLEKFCAGKKHLAENNIDLNLLFANDGSCDSTCNILTNYCDGKNTYVYDSKVNLGKADVIQKAFESKLEGSNIDHYDWIGFWDADLATSLDEIPKMLNYINLYNLEVDSIWGSRISRLGSQIKRQPHRHYLGRIFVTIVSSVLGVKAYDSQCGAKLFKPQAARAAFASSFVSRWIFDVEILLRLKKFTIVEFPLLNWEDVPGSKVKVFKESFRTLADIWKIKKHYSKNL
jgi:dolichyl-phosphate beta-glucosyltransferase